MSSTTETKGKRSWNSEKKKENEQLTLKNAYSSKLSGSKLHKLRKKTNEAKICREREKGT